MPFSHLVYCICALTSSTEGPEKIKQRFVSLVRPFVDAVGMELTLKDYVIDDKIQQNVRDDLHRLRTENEHKHPSTTSCPFLILSSCFNLLLLDPL